MSNLTQNMNQGMVCILLGEKATALLNGNVFDKLAYLNKKNSTIND